MPHPSIDRLESRRLLAVIASDVTWGEDGYANAAHPGMFAARSGDGFLTAENEFDTDWTTTVRRYTDAGNADTAFTPIRRTALSGDTRVLTDNQARVIVVATATGGDRVVLNRYRPDGRPDVSFAGGATSFFPAGAKRIDRTYGGVLNAVVGDDGATYVLTRITYTDSAQVVIAVTKFRADGQVDSAYGTGGVATLNDVSNTDGVRANMCVDPAGRVLVSLPSPKYSGLSVRRLTAAGQADTAYGNDGQLLFNVGMIMDGGMAVDAAGRLIVVRNYGTGGYPIARGQVLRFTAKGRTDHTFGRKGLSQPLDAIDSFGTKTTISLLPDGTFVTQLGRYIARLGENGLAVRRGVFELKDDSVHLAAAKADGTLLADDVTKAGDAVTRLSGVPPAAAGKSGTLYVNGASRVDTFAVRPVGPAGRLAVYVAGERYGVFNGIKAIAADLGDGDDTLLAAKVSVPVTVDAGGGNDTVATGSGVDTIDLGPGSNALDAGSGGGTVEATGAKAGVQNIINGVGGGRDGWTVRVHAGSLRVGLVGRTIKVDIDVADSSVMVLNATLGATVFGSDGVDRISTGRGDDSVNGGLGDDLIDTGTGRDTLDGGPGFDRCRHGGDDDEIDGFEAEWL